MGSSLYFVQKEIGRTIRVNIVDRRTPRRTRRSGHPIMSSDTRTHASAKRHRLRWLRRVALVVLSLAALVAIHDLIRQPAAPTYLPIVAPTTLDELPPPPGDDVPCADPPDRWIIVAWDGASWDLVLPLLLDGRLPTLGRLMREGVHGNLYGFVPSRSPALWTTVATGVSPDRHGIRGFDKRSHLLLRRLERIVRLGGVERELYTNADRRVRALWNLTTENGRSSLIVGWHNSFPAESIDGMFVSNYLEQTHMARLLRVNRTLPPELAGALVHPPEALDEVLELERRTRESLTHEVSRFADYSPEELRIFLDEAHDPQDDEARLRYLLGQAYVADTLHAEIALTFYPRLAPDLLMLHFQAVDIASHGYLVFHRPEMIVGRPPPPTDLLERLSAEQSTYEQTLGAFYEYLDEQLGRLLELRDERTAVLVLSDHGFESRLDDEGNGTHDAGPPGILVMHGPSIRSAARIEGATLYDILPTVLAAMRLPLSRELEGEPLLDAFCGSARDALSPTYIDTYEDQPRYQPRIEPPAEMERAVEERLRSLGYIQ